MSRPDSQGIKKPIAILLKKSFDKIDPWNFRLVCEKQWYDTLKLLRLLDLRHPHRPDRQELLLVLIVKLTARRIQILLLFSYCLANDVRLTYLQFLNLLPSFREIFERLRQCDGSDLDYPIEHLWPLFIAPSNAIMI